MKKLEREYIRDEIVTIDVPMKLHDFIRLLKKKNKEIMSELGGTIHYQILVDLVEGEPELELSIYKSDGGF